MCFYKKKVHNTNSNNNNNNSHCNNNSYCDKIKDGCCFCGYIIISSKNNCVYRCCDVCLETKILPYYNCKN